MVWRGKNEFASTLVPIMYSLTKNSTKSIRAAMRPWHGLLRYVLKRSWRAVTVAPVSARYIIRTARPTNDITRQKAPETRLLIHPFHDAVSWQQPYGGMIRGIKRSSEQF